MSAGSGRILLSFRRSWFGTASGLSTAGSVGLENCFDGLHCRFTGCAGHHHHKLEAGPDFLR